MSTLTTQTTYTAPVKVFTADGQYGLANAFRDCAKQGYTPVSAPLAAFLRSQPDSRDLWFNSSGQRIWNDVQSTRLKAKTKGGAEVILFNHTGRALDKIMPAAKAGEANIQYTPAQMRAAIQQAEQGTLDQYGLPLVTLMSAELFNKFTSGQNVSFDAIREHPQTEGFFGPKDSAVGDIAAAYVNELRNQGFSVIRHYWVNDEIGAACVLALGNFNDCGAVNGIYYYGGRVVGVGEPKASANKLVGAIAPTAPESVPIKDLEALIAQARKP